MRCVIRHLVMNVPAVAGSKKVLRSHPCSPQGLSPSPVSVVLQPLGQLMPAAKEKAAPISS